MAAVDDGVSHHGPSGGPAAPALPGELQDLAEAIRLAQQRIQASVTTPREQVELSRELRRAVQAGRHQPAEGRRRLAELQARMDAPER